MAARTRSKVTPKYRAKYRVGNWPAYDAALRARGDVTVWFDEATVSAWNAPPSGRPGGQRRYSGLAIVTALTWRTVFHVALRQTEGFVGSRTRVLGLALHTPDHSTLSRRNRDVEVPRLARRAAGPLHLVIDSTGLKRCGGGQWQAHRHGTSGQPRSWRKLHLGVGADGYVIASALTDSGADDACANSSEPLRHAGPWCCSETPLRLLRHTGSLLGARSAGQRQNARAPGRRWSRRLGAGSHASPPRSDRAGGYPPNAA
jgi:hypothetical protein